MTTDNTNTGLDISDIQTVVAIIDHACQEGAFKGWEVINKVAGVRTRLASFLEVIAAAQKAQADMQAESAPAATQPDAVATTGQTGPVGPTGPEPTGNDEAAPAPGA